MGNGLIVIDSLRQSWKCVRFDKIWINALLVRGGGVSVEIGVSIGGILGIGSPSVDGIKVSQN